ncbi:unnamed protein product [Urochloa humidicola]
MARLACWVACLLLAAATAVAESDDTETLSTYIVHVAQAHAPRQSSRPCMLSSAYSSFLRDHLPAQVARPAPTLLYSYAHAATGFAARLTEAQAAHLASQESSVLAVVPDTMHQLHTTLSPSFLGLSESSSGSGGYSRHPVAPRT